METDRYIINREYRKALGLPEEVTEEYRLLAQGEYNVNYEFSHPSTGRRLVLRVNTGSQMHLDRQIEYEAHALKMLQEGCSCMHPLRAEPESERMDDTDRDAECPDVCTGDAGMQGWRTPRVLYVDDTRHYIDNGILVEEYLPGRYPSYDSREDMSAVMQCLADIHCVPVSQDDVIWGEPEEVPRDTVKLIAPGSGMDAIIDECEAMVKTYMESPLGDDITRARLRALLDRGHEIVCAAGAAGNNRSDDHPQADVHQDQLYRCIINTELNSTNFLIEDIPEEGAAEMKDPVTADSCSGPDAADDSGRTAQKCGVSSRCGSARRYARLVDWEKPLYGDPAQDLGHLLAPTTTFWKTDAVLTAEETERLIAEYIEAVDGRYCTRGLADRIHQYITITCLRGLTWCAMAWVEYRDPSRPITNESTRVKLDQYLSDPFLSRIEEIFRDDP